MSLQNWSLGPTSRTLYAPDGRIFARIVHVFDMIDHTWSFTAYVCGMEEAEFATVEEAETFVETSYLLTYGG